MDDDYYSLLGVKPSAEAADIKAAYRDKKAALDAKGAKGSVAALNKAWNVLSDPYQRGRYDAGREAEAEADGDSDADDVDVTTDDAPPARRRFFEPAPKRDRNAPKPEPTVDVPEGYALPEPRRRVTAMVIDLMVLLVVFVGSQYAASEYNKSNHEAEVDRISAIDDELDDLNDEKNDLEDELDDLEAEDPEAEDPVPTEQVDASNDEIDALDDRIDDLEEERSDVTSELSPAYQLAYTGAFAFGFLFLVVPSAMTGRTLGKKLRNLKVVRMDGSPLGITGALFRYGILVVGAYVLSLLLPLLGVAIVLFIVLGWMRNPNQQGMHDRTSKTLVVTEASDG